jgi:hypothetical protein
MPRVRRVWKAHSPIVDCGRSSVTNCPQAAPNSSWQDASPGSRLLASAARCDDRLSSMGRAWPTGRDGWTSVVSVSQVAREYSPDQPFGTTVAMLGKRRAVLLCLRAESSDRSWRNRDLLQHSSIRSDRSPRARGGIGQGECYMERARELLGGRRRHETRQDNGCGHGVAAIGPDASTHM